MIPPETIPPTPRNDTPPQLELSDKEVFVASCMTLEDNATVANMVQHVESGTVVVQMLSGELFELHEGMLEPWGNEGMRVSCCLFVLLYCCLYCCLSDKEV